MSYVYSHSYCLQEAKGLKGKIEDVLDNKVGPAARDAVTSTTQRSVEETQPQEQDTTLGKCVFKSFFVPKTVVYYRRIGRA